MYRYSIHFSQERIRINRHSEGCRWCWVVMPLVNLFCLGDGKESCLPKMNWRNNILKFLFVFMWSLSMEWRSSDGPCSQPLNCQLPLLFQDSQQKKNQLRANNTTNLPLPNFHCCNLSFHGNRVEKAASNQQAASSWEWELSFVTFH